VVEGKEEESERKEKHQKSSCGLISLIIKKKAYDIAALGKQW